MNKKLTTAVICLLFVSNMFSQEVNAKKSFGYRGFVGGMLLHTGYVWSNNFQLTDTKGNIYDRQFKGLAYGIGGQIRIILSDHFRVGTEGYVTNHSFRNGSFVSTGWGGILADCFWTIGKFYPFIGGTIGGGSQKSIDNFNPLNNDYTVDEKISYRKFSFACATPFVGFEYAMTSHIHLMFKVDYLFNISNPQKDFLTGPRLYFGFAFCR